MIKLFDSVGGKIVPTEHCYAISQFNTVIKKYNKNVHQIIPYIFYMSFLGDENPYFNYPVETKEDMIKKDLQIEFSLDDILIKKAIEKATEMYTTPTRRGYLIIRKKIEEILDYLDDTAITDGRDGNFKDQTSFIEKYHKYNEISKSLSRDLEEEQKEVHARGGSQMAYDQKK